MSYCRWSSDDYQSDIYCYQDISMQYVIMVAYSRYVSDTPRPILLDVNSTDEWIKHHYAINDWCKNADIQPIGLPSDGQHFYFATYQETIDKLLQLREEGYRVPQHAIDELREELTNDLEP